MLSVTDRPPTTSAVRIASSSTDRSISQTCVHLDRFFGTSSPNEASTGPMRTTSRRFLVLHAARAALLALATRRCATARGDNAFATSPPPARMLRRRSAPRFDAAARTSFHSTRSAIAVARDTGMPCSEPNSSDSKALRYEAGGECDRKILPRGVCSSSRHWRAFVGTLVRAASSAALAVLVSVPTLRRIDRFRANLGPVSGAFGARTTLGNVFP
mmetsp:Transcript_14509/g.45600  ORF Transcript_14509/g.45600 Transcript_14509/m.45600 type:complete len:215 (+) Transcript_14509:794-1438(+)